jgi:hypothetical protein
MTHLLKLHTWSADGNIRDALVQVESVVSDATETLTKINRQIGGRMNYSLLSFIS